MNFGIRHVFAVAMLSVFLAVGARSQSQTIQFESLTPEQLKSLVIHFERTGCYGNCPAYGLTVFGDGRVDYVGKRDVKVIGKRSGSVDEAGLRAILAAFSKAKFTSIGENVSEEKCSCNTCTDFPTVITDLAFEKAAYSVRHYHGCACAGKELFDLEAEIDRIAKSDQWTGDVSKAGPFGTTCFAPKPSKPK